METLNRWQTRAPHLHGTFSPPVIVSPYFQPTVTRKSGETDGNIRIIPETMNLKALVTNYSVGPSNPQVSMYLESDDNTIKAGVTLPLAPAYSDVGADVRSGINTTITSFCTGISLPAPTIEWLITTPTDLAAVIPSGLSSAPQAAIANAPADAVTNYNIVTTLLGSLTSAVNTANDKQNQIATKLNSLLTELRTLGLISP